jgi:DNA-binding IclR family transcriptional regulator
MISLINILAANAEAVSLKHLAIESGLHPSSAHRILGVMVEKGFAERVEHGNYQLGIRLLELGNLVKARLNVRQAAQPFMQKLCDELGETVNLSVRQADEIVYVERVSADKAMMRVVQVIGARAPLHITAVGKMFLAQEGADGCKAYAKRSGMKRFTPNTITTAAKLIKEIDHVNSLGYATDKEEAEKGVCCIGAGILDSAGNIIAGLSVSAPADRLKLNWAGKVKETADEISRSLGYRS